MKKIKFIIQDKDCNVINLKDSHKIKCLVDFYTHGGTVQREKVGKSGDLKRDITTVINFISDNEETTVFLFDVEICEDAPKTLSKNKCPVCKGVGSHKVFCPAR